jgi:hypothetical protein
VGGGLSALSAEAYRGLSVTVIKSFTISYRVKYISDYREARNYNVGRN